MQQWLPGHRLKNRPYEIEQELGQGGFGVIYKAKNLALDVPLVIKTPNIRLQRDANYSKYVENFTREAKQLAKLGMNPHPHIVRVLDFFQEDNLPCMVMDFVPGESLYDLVQIQGALSEAKALQYIKQIGSALIVCHKARIIHRDVHPNNILIHAESGNAILIDFGISGTTQTSRNTHSGNRAFAPWEQIAHWEQQNSKTPQVDIYTLAASFYYLVTGEIPTECLARKYNNAELIEPKELDSSLSLEINQAILKGMQIKPGDQPQTVKEWLELLKQSAKFLPSLREAKGDLLQIFEFDTIKVNDQGEVIKTEHRSAKYFTEDLGNGITIDMVEILGGTFLMGSPEDEKYRNYNESPRHKVRVPNFYMAKFQVTQAQWKRIAILPPIERKLYADPSYFKEEDLPVKQLSWDDAVEFCKRLSKHTGKEYRLPSEAEWEYACRTGTTTPFHYGETITKELANYFGNYTVETTPVGSFPPNAFGLYDMHGNVWEWCADSWHGNYQGAPNDGSAWLSENSFNKVIRGGSWHSRPYNCRSAYRNFINRDGHAGFRVVGVAPRTT
jgi:formylglycine-generating enzyme required for sulfatase activity